MKEAKRTLYRVILLIWVLAAAVLAIGGILYLIKPFAFLPYFLGELLGSTVSMLLMLHRFSTLEVELDMNKKRATNHLKVMATLRTVFALVPLLVSCWVPWLFSPVTVFAGLFATKMAALLFPVVFRENKELPNDL